MNALAFFMALNIRKTFCRLMDSTSYSFDVLMGVLDKISNLIPLGKIATNPTKITQISYCFMSRNLEFNSKQNTDITEEIEIIKLQPRQVIDMIMKGEIWAADSVAFILKAYHKYPKLFKAKK